MTAEALDALRRLGALDGPLRVLGGPELAWEVEGWLRLDRGLRRRTPLEAAWTDGNPVPMIALAFLAGLDRELELALVDVAEVWAKAVPHPTAGVLVRVLGRTVGAPPGARAAVVEPRLALYRVTKAWPNPAPKARALLALSRVWVLASPGKKLEAVREATRWGAGVVHGGADRRWVSTGSPVLGAEATRVAARVRARVPFDVLAAALVGSLEGP